MLQVCEATKEESGNKLASPLRGRRAARNLIPGNNVRFSYDLTDTFSFKPLTAGLQRAGPNPLLKDSARRRLFQSR
jgi:hypothetical protein